MTAADWTHHAACSNSPQPDIWFLEGTREGRAAAAICRRQCPVTTQCLIAALDEEAGTPAAHRFGIRGGLLPEERHRIHTGRRVTTAA